MLFRTLFFAGTAAATCSHGLSFTKRQEGEAVEVKEFGYTGLIGPQNWASFGEENTACKTGKNQSPINLDSSITTSPDKPTVVIEPQPVIFENLGTTIEVVVNGTTSFAGNDFRLVQFHVHTPSEHRIDDEYFPLEAHFVHEGVADPQQIVVIGVLFQLTTAASNPLLAGLQPHLAAIATPGTSTTIEAGLDFSSLITHVQTTDLFTYSGSLTTPPCRESVTFVIAKTPLDIDVDTFNEMKKIVKFNARYTQNTLGEANLIEVGTKAGTPEQWDPPKKEEGEGAQAEVAASPVENGNAAGAQRGPLTKGASVVITNIAGVPTSLVGVIVKGR